MYQARWTRQDADRSAIEAALERPSREQDVIVKNFDRNRELVAWLAGTITADDFGWAIAECRNKYEREAGSCLWEQDIVLKRQSDGRGEVVAIQPRLTDDAAAAAYQSEPPNAACLAWAQCTANAWRGRTGPFPANGEDFAVEAADGSLHVALRSLVFHGSHTTSERSEYTAEYVRAQQEVEEKVEARRSYLTTAKLTDLQELNLRYNLALEEGWVEDHANYIAWLKKQPEESP